MAKTRFYQKNAIPPAFNTDSVYFIKSGDSGDKILLIVTNEAGTPFYHNSYTREEITVLLSTLASISHTHTESDISDLDKYTQLQVDNLLNTKIDTTEKGAINGVAELDSAGTVPSSQLPSYVDDVLEFANFASLPVTGEVGKVYVTLDTNLTYRWSGSAYIIIGNDLALGETSATAYRGDRGKIAYDHSLLAHIFSIVAGEPTGSTTISNIVWLTQAQYDAAEIALEIIETTVYIIKG